MKRKEICVGKTYSNGKKGVRRVTCIGPGNIQYYDEVRKLTRQMTIGRFVTWAKKEVQS